MGHDRTPRIRNFPRRHEERRNRAALTGNGGHGRRPGGGVAGGRRKSRTGSLVVGNSTRRSRAASVCVQPRIGRNLPSSGSARGTWQLREDSKRINGCRSSESTQNRSELTGVELQPESESGAWASLGAQGAAQAGLILGVGGKKPAVLVAHEWSRNRGLYTGQEGTFGWPGGVAIYGVTQNREHSK